MTIKWLQLAIIQSAARMWNCSMVNIALTVWVTKAANSAAAEMLPGMRGLPTCEASFYLHICSGQQNRSFLLSVYFIGISI